jgi:hypothetical protein
MKKKTFWFLGTLALAFTLIAAGCGNGTAGDDDDNPGSGSPAEQFAAHEVLSGKTSVNGNTVTLQEQVTIPAGTTLTIPENLVLSTSSRGEALILEGTLRLEPGASLVLDEYTALGVREGGGIFKGDTSSAQGLTAEVSGSAVGTCFKIDLSMNGKYYLIYKTTNGNTTTAVLGNLGITASTGSLWAAVSNEPAQDQSIQTGTGTILTITGNPFTGIWTRTTGGQTIYVVLTDTTWSAKLGAVVYNSGTYIYRGNTATWTVTDTGTGNANVGSSGSVNISNNQMTVSSFADTNMNGTYSKQ